jgi:uncharacterized membrane protein YkoI
MKTLKLILTVACVAVLTAVVLPSYAGGGDDKAKHAREHEEIRAAMQRGEVLPLGKILAIAQEKVPGDVIEVELENKHGALVYEIKVLTESGRVREVKIDARKGTVIKIEDD